MDAHGRERERYKVPYGAVIDARDGAAVKAGQTVAKWDPHTHPIVSEVAGVIRFIDFIDGNTVQEQIDELTGLASSVVTDPKRRGSAAKDLRPMVRLVDKKGGELRLPGTDIPAQYFLPAGAIVSLQNGAEVGVGDVVARIPQETSKTRDITGGLPRVADLFEARKPKEPAILAERSGVISFGKDTKGKQRLIIRDADGNEHEELIPEVAPRDRVRRRARREGRDRRRRRAQSARHPASARRRAARGLPRQGNPGRLPPAGRQDQRQAHRSDHSPDAAQDRGLASPATRVICVASRSTAPASWKRTAGPPRATSAGRSTSRSCSASPRRRWRPSRSSRRLRSRRRPAS